MSHPSTVKTTTFGFVFEGKWAAQIVATQYDREEICLIAAICVTL